MKKNKAELDPETALLGRVQQYLTRERMDCLAMLNQWEELTKSLKQLSEMSKLKQNNNIDNNMNS